MRIGEIGALAGVDSQTIRFYEREGLLPDPRREPNGYRSYDSAVVGRLQFIRSAQGAGLTLAEISSTLRLRDAGEVPCAHVCALLAQKLVDVQIRQRELAALSAELSEMIETSRSLDPGDCFDANVCHIITPLEGM
ncbi:DNA-binding transcriptional MerR regulator [Arthrobacter sp. CAN_A212]|uniref:heavy metal-responsive transcriptional regulator n=1 Tax=unclassified Arthrobacter TaxID=235627 RepID=UPI0018CB0CEB|nr:heavy metal-responsive transcriptional regulator [Arthrobacter sp. CAN_C5]MBP2217629.1 DNA-binding transcriptional MerR regulator [Arthrobacter sp. CAN_C5]